MTELMSKLFTHLCAALLALTLSLGASLPALAAEDDSAKEIENTEVVAAGTYTVTAERVDPEEKEIYVKTEDGKTVELYFKDDTKLTQAGKDVPFTTLKKGQKLEVMLEKEGNSNKPTSVKIME